MEELKKERIMIPFCPEVRKKMSGVDYEIFALCYAYSEHDKTIELTNEVLSKMVKKTTRTIMLILARLEKKGFIKRTFTEEGRVIKITI